MQKNWYAFTVTFLYTAFEITYARTINKVLMNDTVHSDIMHSKPLEQTTFRTSGFAVGNAIVEQNVNDHHIINYRLKYDKVMVENDRMYPNSHFEVLFFKIG